MNNSAWSVGSNGGFKEEVTFQQVPGAQRKEEEVEAQCQGIASAKIWAWIMCQCLGDSTELDLTQSTWAGVGEPHYKYEACESAWSRGRCWELGCLLVGDEWMGVGAGDEVTEQP